MAEVAPAPTNGSLTTNGDSVKPEINDENAPPASVNGENVTVFHDPENFNVKHPLMHTWTLWFTKPPSGKVGSLKGTLPGDQADHTIRAITGTIF